jgi:ElaB/YqjD/DUF883 family membrane-anchored ribosome-binding protein
LMVGLKSSAVVLWTLIASSLILPLAVMPVKSLAQNQDLVDEELPLGLRITAELRSIIREHKEAIREAILEYRLLVENLTERKIELIRSYLMEREQMIGEFRKKVEELNSLYRSGNITKEEYVSQLKSLKDELKVMMRARDKLGRLIQELQAEHREAVQTLVRELREILEDFGQRVAEEARRIRGRIHEEIAPGNETSSGNTGEGASTRGTRTRDNGSRPSSIGEEMRALGEERRERAQANREGQRGAPGNEAANQTTTRTHPSGNGRGGRD